jgi:phosphatidylinositol alpha-mannosyltransferase
MFLGRFEESRKGFPLLLKALPEILSQVPDLEVVVAGGGDVAELHQMLRKAGISWVDGLGSSAGGEQASVRILGRVSEEDKAAALAASDVYVAPNTGGESFGIVLVEAMAAGAAVVASDIPAFAAVTDHGRAGHLFANGSVRDLARVVVGLLTDEEGRRELFGRGTARSREFDWDTVTTRVEQVYETVVTPGRKVVPS